MGCCVESALVWITGQHCFYQFDSLWLWSQRISDKGSNHPNGNNVYIIKFYLFYSSTFLFFFTGNFESDFIHPLYYGGIKCPIVIFFFFLSLQALMLILEQFQSTELHTPLLLLAAGERESNCERSWQSSLIHCPFAGILRRPLSKAALLTFIINFSHLRRLSFAVLVRPCAPA